MFMNGGKVLRTVALKRGKAVLKTASLPLGSDRIQAVYAGGGSFGPSTSGILVERIVAARPKKAPARRAKALKGAAESLSPNADRSRQERGQEQALRTSPIGLSISGGPANALASQLASTQGPRGLAGDPIRPERKRPLDDVEAALV